MYARALSNVQNQLDPLRSNDPRGYSPLLRTTVWAAPAAHTKKNNLSIGPAGQAGRSPAATGRTGDEQQTQRL